ncbi:MAG: hypothetical protein LC111_05095, partial [Bacteroidia bacterium]|nr:hypothetical protein [Bacteroidia bacterium]
EEEARLKAEADAKAKAEAEAAAAAELARKKKEFEELIRNGEKAVEAKQYDNALDYFKSALANGTDIPLANLKNNETEKLKEAEEAKRKAEELAFRKKIFDEKIAEGDNLLNQKRNREALLVYNEALSLDIDNILAQSKIDAVQKILDEIELAQKKAKFTKSIADGDLALNQKKFANAISLYTDALNTEYDNAVAYQKIENARKLEEEEIRRQEEIAAKRQAMLDEIARRKKEAEEREREFKERVRLAREKARLEYQERIEAQKRSLSQADKFREQRQKNMLSNSANNNQVATGPRKELAKKYPQGTTNEEIEGPNCIIYRTIIVKGDVGDEYKKIKYNFGQIYYKKNDRDISESVYNNEVKNN